MTLRDVIAERIRRHGSITFAEYQDAALYEPELGFFATGGGAGRGGGDFVTSPEVGTLFGVLVARYLDRAWEQLGRPDPFVVVEAGAGRGRLAHDVLQAEPVCAPAARYVLVERSPVLRAAQHQLLTLEPPDEVLGPVVRTRDPDEPVRYVEGLGPIATSIDDLPAGAFDGVVVANELLDNLPVRIVERSASGWDEVRVGLDADGGFVEVLVVAPPDLAREADEVATGTPVPVGTRLPVPVAISDWLVRLSALIRRGEVVLIDYAVPIAELVARGPDGWLRTYRGHQPGGAPLDRPGTQDITCEVPLEHLLSAAARAGFDLRAVTSQSEWLDALGLAELVEQGRATWRARAHLGDLEAVAGRSRVTEAEALTDPTGLGAHRVIVLARGLG